MNTEEMELIKNQRNLILEYVDGGASLGKETKYIGQYALEFYFKITNEAFKEKLNKLLHCSDWKSIYPVISTPKLNAWKIYKYIKEQIPEIQ
jgi:hypothetical protein